MPSVASAITINQPVDKVFTYVTSVENHKAWQSGIAEATLTPAGPVALGSIYHYVTQVMGQRIQSQMQVSAFEPNHTWNVKTIGIPRPVETAYLFEPASSGTKLTISMELTGGYPAMAEGAIKAQMQKSLDEQGQRIKKFVEH